MKALILSIIFIGAFGGSRLAEGSSGGRWRYTGREKGLRNSFARDTLYCGETATHGQFPYAASIQTPTGSYYCTAAILDENTFLTAAHCNVYDVDQIAVGKVNSGISEPTEQIVEVAYVTNHESFNSLTMINDIAIVKSETPLTFDTYVSAATLPATQNEEVANSTMCTLSGWGDVSEIGENPTSLSYVGVPIVDDVTCESFGSYISDIVPSMICAGGPGASACCHTGSGAPLMLGEGRVDELVGIASFGHECVIGPDVPRVFTQVSYFLDWIEANRY